MRAGLAESVFRPGEFMEIARGERPQELGRLGSTEVTPKNADWSDQPTTAWWLRLANFFSGCSSPVGGFVGFQTEKCLISIPPSGSLRYRNIPPSASDSGRVPRRAKVIFISWNGAH